jgi:PTH2 family peptidyl-tRNA hydrolase
MERTGMKQVIVMRTDLNMRKGKMIAQGAHAAMACVVAGTNPKNFWKWASNGMKKICVRAGSEEQLQELHRKATEAGLESHLITDAGKTEFHGVATVTCLAIGPNEEADIDKITGDLTPL